METLKLSFIVPVYNVAPYLRKCVDSLLAQNYDNYEIILVNDGSTDDSGALCEEIARANDGMSRDKSLNEPLTLNDGKPIIKVIHQANGGLSAARNAGLKVAKGEYVCFVDSDDYWEPNVLGGLMEQVEREKLDVLRFDYQNVRLKNEGVRELESEREYEVFEPNKTPRYIDKCNEIVDGETYLNTRMSTACYAVMFIIKRSLIYSDQTSVISNQTLKNNTPNIKHQTSNILFTEKIYFEDTDWTPRMLCKAKRVASTNTIVYNYLVREGSITNAVNRSKQKKVLDDKMRLVREMQRQAADLKSLGKDSSWYAKMIAATVISIVGILSTQFYNERKDYLSQLKEFKIFPIQSHSLKARLINFSPRLAVELLHLKHR